MYFEVQDALEELKNAIEKNQMSNDLSNNFLSEDDLEDEYSHNEIDLMHREFMDEARKYLKEHCEGHYIMYSDWCVHILTVEFCKKKGLEDLLKRRIC